mgnify:CR=1 FL=1
MKIIKLNSKDIESAINKIRRRQEKDQKNIERKVDNILDDVKLRGDKSLFELSKKFDNFRLNKKNLFSSKTTKQFYDEEAKQFLADRYIIGTCPCGKFDEAYGDQCEKCGATLSPDELKNPRSAISKSKPILKLSLIHI